MAIVKRTFSIPDYVSAELDKTIPNQEKSRFITHTLIDALQKLNNKKLIKAIDDIESWQSSEESAVDIIRKIRNSHPD